MTSGKHVKNQGTYGAHDSVSNGKPPLHPNHHQNVHNYRNTTSIPVHNSNNRLSNNTVFHNNQYTFSLNRYDDSGYLESTGPLSSASLYGDGPRISRGTKSDIGIPIRHSSASKMQLNSGSYMHQNRNKDKLTSVKSDFLLSYLNNNHNDCNSSTSVLKNLEHKPSDRYGLNNNSESTDCTNPSAYHISGVSSSDISETYKTGTKNIYTNINTSTTNTNTNSKSKSTSNIIRFEHNDRSDRSDQTANQSSRSINEQQRNRIINFVGHSHGTSNRDAKNSTSSASSSYENRQTSNVVGPLLYIDSTSESPSNRPNKTKNDTQNHSFKSVSRKQKQSPIML